MTEPRAKFTQMKDGDAEDYSIIAKSNAKDYDHLADKVLTHLEMLREDYGGFQVDRLTHSLQTATRAYRDGRDEEYVVCALIHDIGDNLAPANHAEFAATILQPFVSEENYWIVKHHGIFQDLRKSQKIVGSQRIFQFLRGKEGSSKIARVES